MRNAGFSATVRFAQGKQREGSAVPVRGELIQIPGFAQNDIRGERKSRRA